MPESGQSWQRAFAAAADQAHAAREWVATHLRHEDARTLASELFTAVLAAAPDKIAMTVSTAGRRARISASGPAELPLTSTHGPAYWLIRGLSTATGVTPDRCGLWADLDEESPCCPAK